MFDPNGAPHVRQPKSIGQALLVSKSSGRPIFAKAKPTGHALLVVKANIPLQRQQQSAFFAKVRLQHKPPPAQLFKACPQKIAMPTSTSRPSTKAVNKSQWTKLAKPPTAQTTKAPVEHCVIPKFRSTETFMEFGIEEQRFKVQYLTSQLEAANVEAANVEVNERSSGASRYNAHGMMDAISELRYKDAVSMHRYKVNGLTLDVEEATAQLRELEAANTNSRCNIEL